MSDVADRLAFLRKGKFRSKAAAAEAYGIGYEIYKKIESHASANVRNLTPDQAKTIADYHGISAGWLLFNEGTPDGQKRIRLEGYIGAGQEMMLYESSDGTFISTDLGSVEGAAFVVDGDSMSPLARKGDLIFVGPARRDIDALVGQECAVLLQDGRRFFKIIQRGSKRGKYDLASYNRDVMRDMEIHSAGPFLALKRNKNGRL